MIGIGLALGIGVGQRADWRRCRPKAEEPIAPPKVRTAAGERL